MDAQADMPTDTESEPEGGTSRKRHKRGGRTRTSPAETLPPPHIHLMYGDEEETEETVSERDGQEQEEPTEEEEAEESDDDG